MPRRLTIRVERSVWEEYDVQVADGFDKTDDMAVQELFAEGENEPEPVDSGEYSWEAEVTNDVKV